jgi:hypothetical protein
MDNLWSLDKEMRSGLLIYRAGVLAEQTILLSLHVRATFVWSTSILRSFFHLHIPSHAAGQY